MTDTTQYEQAYEAPPEAQAEVQTVISMVRDLSHEAMLLVRQELALAKAEMAEKAHVHARNAGYVAGGGAVLYAGVLCLLAAAVAGLTVALYSAIPWYHALWLSALLVGFVVAITGYAMVKMAIKTMKATGVKPEQTAETLRENKQWLRQKKHQ